MPHVTREWKVDGRKVISPETLAEGAVSNGYPTPWMEKVNQIDLPRGYAHGVASFLMRNPDSDAIIVKSKVDITAKQYRKAGNSWVEEESHTWKSWYITKTYAATQAYDSATPVMVVELADKRWVLDQTTTNRRFNLRLASSYIDYSKNSGTAYTWQQVLNTLWSDLPSAIAGTCPTIPGSVPTSTPENLVFEGVSAWRAICEVLTAIGLDVVLDPFKDRFTFVKLTSTQDGLSDLKAKAKREKKWLWEWAPDPLPNNVYPKELKVSFPRTPIQSDDSFPFVGRPEVITSTINSASTSGTSFPLWDNMQAFGPYGSTVNSASLNTRSTEILDAVKGYFRPLAEPSGVVFAGAIEFLPGSQCNRVIWFQDENGMRTEVLHTWQDEPIMWPKISPLPYLPHSLLVYSAGGSTGRSSTTLGTGTGVIQDINSSGVVSNWLNVDGSNVTITFWNSSTSALAGGYMQVKREAISGKFLVDVASCS